MTIRTKVIVLLATLTQASAAAQGPVAPGTRLAYRIESGTRAREILASATTQATAVLEALNRADRQHLPRLEQLVVPMEWLPNVLSYSPFPLQYAWSFDRPRLLVVTQPAQAFAAYESGVLVRWGPVSTGRRPLQTPAGLLHLTWRSRGRRSTVDPDWFMPWYFNFHNHRGLSFHEFALPGRPASHACVRLLERDARWLFEWGETWTLDDRGWTVVDPGTPVLILGCYEFTAPPPWRSLHWLAQGMVLPPIPPTSSYQCR